MQLRETKKPFYFGHQNRYFERCQSYWINTISCFIVPWSARAIMDELLELGLELELLSCNALGTTFRRPPKRTRLYWIPTQSVITILNTQSSQVDVSQEVFIMRPKGLDVTNLGRSDNSNDALKARILETIYNQTPSGTSNPLDGSSQSRQQQQQQQPHQQRLPFQTQQLGFSSRNRALLESSHPPPSLPSLSHTGRLPSFLFAGPNPLFPSFTSNANTSNLITIPTSGPPLQLPSLQSPQKSQLMSRSRWGFTSIRISMTILRFFVHEAAVTFLWPYGSKPLSVMSKRAYRFPSFYNRFVSLESTSTLMFFRGLTQVTHETVFVFPFKRTHACQLPAPTLPSHLYSSALLLSSILFTECESLTREVSECYSFVPDEFLEKIPFNGFALTSSEVVGKPPQFINK
ncbi:hypothetical protein ACTXT7_001129 [Hymenolepis weldensis]